jgi:hypothetical protein
MTRCADLEHQIVGDDNRTDELRKLLHAKEGENLVDAAKRVIVPLPKPERVEPGQRWAFVMTSESKLDQFGYARFYDASGSPTFTADSKDFEAGFYLGA